MKTTKLILSAMLVSALFASCSSDDTAGVTINQPGGGVVTPVGENAIGGVINSDLTLTSATKEYTLTSALIIEDGVTLTIEPGVVIRAAFGSDVYVAIQQGGKIMAEGTSTSPIVFTSSSATPNAGDWGGLIVLGRAPINSVTGGDATATSEIGGLRYGGSNPEDSSGIIKYVRIEYSGGKADASSENNGFSFYGVGSGTTVQYIQAFEGKDDGVEFFGGTVNASFISVIGAQDDSVDWTEGYSGTLNDIYIEHGLTYDRGIEGDGFSADIGNNSESNFFSAPTLNNVTIIGRGSTAVIVEEDGEEKRNKAVNLRVGTRAIFNSVSIVGFNEGFDLDGGENQPTGEGVVEGLTKINNATFSDVNVKLKNDTGIDFAESDLITETTEEAGTDYDAWNTGWTRN